MMVLLLAVSASCVGQADNRPIPDSGPMPPPEDMGKGPGRFGMGFGWGFDDDQERNLENLRLLKLLEFLDLDDDQSPQFILIFSDFRKDTRQLHDEIKTKVGELAELLKADNPSDSQIEGLIKNIDELRLGHVKIAEEFHRKASEILTTVQMGKMVVFESRFEKELIGTVRGFRGGMKNRPNRQEKN
jgi:Spy/CpxP family protein refolding chaperone